VEGCWRADPDFFFQTQHGPRANSAPNDGIPTGWSIVGRPNYWDEYTHGRLGYDRCDKRRYTNDKFAVDYPLDRGDAVFLLFEGGTVTFAGRNDSHKDYGILVSIKASNGKYVSLSGHLNSLARGLKGVRGSTGTPSSVSLATREVAPSRSASRTCTKPTTATPATTPTGRRTEALGCR
jgi:hypothetical protein